MFLSGSASVIRKGRIRIRITKRLDPDLYWEKVRIRARMFIDQRYNKILISQFKSLLCRKKKVKNEYYKVGSGSGFFFDDRIRIWVFDGWFRTRLFSRIGPWSATLGLTRQIFPKQLNQFYWNKCICWSNDNIAMQHSIVNCRTILWLFCNRLTTKNK